MLSYFAVSFPVVVPILYLSNERVLCAQLLTPHIAFSHLSNVVLSLVSYLMEFDEVFLGCLREPERCESI